MLGHALLQQCDRLQRHVPDLPRHRCTGLLLVGPLSAGQPDDELSAIATRSATANAVGLQQGHRVARSPQVQGSTQARKTAPDHDHIYGHVALQGRTGLPHCTLAS